MAGADSSEHFQRSLLRNYLAASALRAVGVSRDIGGISASSKPATNMGIGATRPQRFNSQRARMNFVSGRRERDRKSTRLNSSHLVISYAVFCLKKKNKQ